MVVGARLLTMTTAFSTLRRIFGGDGASLSVESSGASSRLRLEPAASLFLFGDGAIVNRDESKVGGSRNFVVGGGGLEVIYERAGS